MNKKLLTTLQIAITAGLLAWLFRDGQQNRVMLEALSRANLYWIGAAFFTFGVVEFAAIIRWQILLRVQGVQLGWLRLAALYMIGILFNPFLPGGTGGDVAKIYYLLKEVPEKKGAALMAVLMDRLVGLVGLILIACLVIGLRYDWLTQTPAATGLLYTLLLIFVGSFAFVAVSFAITGLGLVHKLPQRMPMRSQLVDISVAYHHYARAWKTTLLALLFSIPVHLGSFTLFYCVAQAFSESAQSASLMDFWGISPIVNTLSSIPISIGGTGIREGLFIKLLGDLCQIPEAVAKLISLTGYMAIVMWALVGGIVYLLYRPTEHAKLSQISRDVAEVEQELAQAEEAEETKEEEAVETRG